MNPQTTEAQLDRLLRHVEKPARYTGGETHEIVKDPATVKVSLALAFPDIYDIGMSYHGYKILYERINAHPGWSAERAFAPWPDMEGLMRQAGLPLFALESKRGLKQFDILGFTLQHEVNYTNILNMLDLAGLPVESKDRPDLFPLVVGGGEGALAPEPMAPFFDLFVLGDGEEPLDRLMQLVEKAKAEGGIDKATFLRQAESIPGIYVPSHFDVEYAEDGTIKRYFPVDQTETNTMPSFRKALFDLRQDTAPVNPIVPNMRVVHDRLAIEIKRGCTRGCRFCSAGMINRPVRERTPDQILDIAREGLKSTGFDEISLLSLSSADYSCILPSVRLLRRNLNDRRVSISLPSLRINAFDIALAEEIAQVRKTGFTFAPEAGSARLRRVINKGIEEESFLEIIEQVCQRGWRTLKFYFMIGLPTETDEDLDGIVQLVRQAERIGMKRWGRGLRINVTLSPYVPKAHTPFQWVGQASMEELQRKYEHVAGQLRCKTISIKSHNPRNSFIEAVIARGDRRMSRAILQAWQAGAKFDGWLEHFQFDLWMQAFQEAGIDPQFYANRERSKDEVFSWDHIEPGLGRRFLWKEWQLAQQEKEVPDCSVEGCAGCDVCGEGVSHQMANEVWEAPEELLQALPKTDKRQAPSPSQSAVQRLRFFYSRTGAMKFLSHLDIIKILQMACQRANLRPAYSEGFHPMPKMQFLPPLPLGFQAREDLFDIQIIEKVDPAKAIPDLNEALPAGIRILRVEETALKMPSPEVCLARSEFQVELPADLLQKHNLNPESVKEKLAAFQAAETFQHHRQASKTRSARTVELKICIVNLNCPEWDSDGNMKITLTLNHEGGQYADPLTCLSTLFDAPLGFDEGADVSRTKIHLKDASEIPQSPRKNRRRKRNRTKAS